MVSADVCADLSIFGPPRRATVRVITVAPALARECDALVCFRTREVADRHGSAATRRAFD
jgi:hypothetical protein